MVKRWTGRGWDGTKVFAVDTGQSCDKGKVSLWNMSLQFFPIIKKLKIEENYWLINVI